MLKGVTRLDDAKRAVDAGVTAISVSNHGGNNLDGTPATIRVLPDIARAVGDQVEVLQDGGVRNASPSGPRGLMTVPLADMAALVTPCWAARQARG
jgi:hypothetical protein